MIEKLHIYLFRWVLDDNFREDNCDDEADAEEEAVWKSNLMLDLCRLGIFPLVTCIPRTDTKYMEL